MNKMVGNSPKSINFDIDEIMNLYSSYVDINVELGDYFNNAMRELELIIKFDYSNLLVIDGDIVEELIYKDGHVYNKLYRFSDIDSTIYSNIISDTTMRTKNIDDPDIYNDFAVIKDAMDTKKYSHVILPIIYNEQVIGLFAISSSASNISESLEEISVYMDFLKLRIVNRLKNYASRINEEIVYALDYITDGYMIIRDNLVTLSKKAQKIFKFDESISDLNQIVDTLKPESAGNVKAAIGKRLEVMTLVVHTNDNLVLEVQSFLVKLSNKSDMTVSVISDVTNEKNKLDRYENLAFIDSLTRLKNYNSLMDSFKKIDNNEDLTIINFDINKFKLINDTNGHNIGDIALIFFGTGLTYAYKGLSDEIFRKSGDEFIVILNDEISKEQIISAFDKLTEFFEDRANYPNDLPVKLEYSAGVASSIEINRDKDDLFKFADIAMYEAKNVNIGTPYVFFDEKRLTSYVEEKEKVDSIVDAIQNDKIEIGYKAIMCTDGTIHGYKTMKMVNGAELTKEDIASIKSKKELLFILEVKALEKVLSELADAIKNGTQQFELQIPIKVEFLIITSFYNEVLRLTEMYNLSANLITFVVVDLNSSTDIENVVRKLNKYIENGYTFTFDFKTTEFPNTYYLKLLNFEHYSVPEGMLDVIRSNDSSRDLVYLRTLFYALIEMKIEPIFEETLSDDEINSLVEHNVKYYTRKGDENILTINDITKH